MAGASFVVLGAFVELGRVHFSLAGQYNLEVQVRSGMPRIACISDTTDRLTCIDFFTGFHPLLIEVGVEYHRTVPKPQPHLLAAVAAILDPLNCPFCNSQYWCTLVCLDINTLMLTTATGITKPGNDVARALIGHGEEKGRIACKHIFRLPTTILSDPHYVLMHGCFNLMLITAPAAHVNEWAKSQEQQQEVSRKL